MHVADIENALVSTSNPTSVDICDYMKKAYPQLKATEGDLELGAKVVRWSGTKFIISVVSQKSLKIVC
ncbi:hypothetical protein [Vibrio splendidus]|uniref:hypothetical protein n=1 Tax=Vibrio splendidus TaxID=29497 RepID=UPI0003000DAE|nr:hypothetical protein [Vibrio splendidus]MDP2589503.1 hypothetical protein [Vibrio splendidus]OEE55170.1 hypothetical protein A146_19215 [Vibrio splendidus FF-500]